MSGPYEGLDAALWAERARELADAHPRSKEEWVDVVSLSWSAIVDSRLGGKFRTGYDISPKPQIMGFLLHELIPLNAPDALDKRGRSVAKAVRAHRPIENSLHWAPDVAFEEDRARNRKGNGPETLAILGGLTLNLLRKALPKLPAGRKRKRSGGSAIHCVPSNLRLAP